MVANPMLGKEADFDRKPIPEIRLTGLVEYTYPAAPHLSLRARAAYEYRYFFESGDAGRFRGRLLARYTLSRRHYLTLWDEWLLMAPPNLVAPNVFDIHRASLLYGYSLGKHATLEGGYQFSHRQRKSLSEWDNEHALVLNVLFAL